MSEQVMSERGEDDLIALVSREQRGFRIILYAGLATLLVLVAMSAALGVYYYSVSQKLETDARELQRQAFDTRIRVDQQSNRVATTEFAIRRAYDEIRGASGGGANASATAPALAAARAFLQHGRHTIADDRLIEAAAQVRADSAPSHLLAGAAALIAWNRAGETIQRDAAALPDQLLAAEAAFKAAGADPTLAPLAQNGLAWVLFLNASSQRSNFAAADCEAVLSAVAASAEAARIGPQPLFWRAQCERKMGRTRESLADYTLSLAQNSDEAASSNDIAVLTLAMNAYHGVGTTMIAAFGAPEDAALASALSLATRVCAPAESAAGSPRMRLALACLNQAVRLRQRLRQTENQLSGTRENMGFAYLRDADFQGAYANAVAVERTGLFAWNELVRALAASHVGEDADEAEARRNVSFFNVGQFNLCELRVLLNPDLFNEAQALIASEHPGEPVACAQAD
jgi:hypothetical protein